MTKHELSAITDSVVMQFSMRAHNVNCSAVWMTSRLAERPQIFHAPSPRRRWRRTRAASTSEGTVTAKTALRELCSRAERGRSASLSLRGEIEEAQVMLEGLSSTDVDYTMLPGRWRLIYTNTRDVLPLLYLNKPPFMDNLPWPVKVGSIFQEFSSPADGKVQNIIKLGFEGILEDEGLTLTVDSQYEVSSGQRISLRFRSASVDDVQISPLVESILAPAVLPRTGATHQLLLAIREFSLSVPLRREGDQRDTAGYLLTYLDEDMLIGRPLDNGGTFIFNKEITEETFSEQWAPADGR